MISSSTKTHPLGLSIEDFSFDEWDGVESPDSAWTRACGARTLLDAATDTSRLLGASGMGLETFRLGTLLPSLSSVALSFACSSCKSLKPFDLAEVALTTLAGEALPDLAGALLVVLAKGEGEDGPAADARFRVLVERAKDGRPEGDFVSPGCVRRIDGEARLDIDAVVLDFGRLGRGGDTRCARASSSEEPMSTDGRLVGG